MNHRIFLLSSLVLALLIGTASAQSELRTLEVTLQGIETDQGQIMVAIFQGEEGFANPRAPFRRITIAPTGSVVTILIHDLPPGDYAVSAFHDVDGNARLDANALGIPKEPTGFSNTPQTRMGRPDFSDVKVDLASANGQTDIQLRVPRMSSARWGVGVGVVMSRSPYVGGDSVAIPIPVINYYGERFFLVGIRGGYSLIRWPGMSLSLVGQYAFAGSVFEESSFLEDMDRRKNTVLAGLSLSHQNARGFTTQLEWKSDILGVHDGQLIDVSLGRRYRFGNASLTPSVGLGWKSQSYTRYFYGVEEKFAREDRPAYDPGASWAPFLQLSGLWSPAEAWSLIAILRTEFFDDEVKDSPLIEDDAQTSAILGFSYSF